MNSTGNMVVREFTGELNSRCIVVSESSRGKTTVESIYGKKNGKSSCHIERKSTGKNMVESVTGSPLVALFSGRPSGRGFSK